MTSRLLICLILLILCHFGHADEPTTKSSPTDHPSEHHSQRAETSYASREVTDEPGQSYLVTVAEFEVAGLVESPQTSHQMPDLLFQKIKSDDLKPLEVVRLSAMSNVAVFANHSKRVQRTVATTSSGLGRGPQQVQSRSDVEIGSILEIKITPGDRQSIAGVRFEKSDLLQKDAPDESSIRSTTIETTVAIEDGKPVLLGSTSEGTPRFFVLMIRAM